MRKFFAAAVVSAVALVGFAGAAGASATIDLIWNDNGTDTIGPGVPDTAAIRLNVILTAGPLGSQGAGVSVDYSQVAGLSVVSFSNTPCVNPCSLPSTLGPATDTGSRVENINSAAIIFLGIGTGLTAEGQSHQLGTVTFNKSGVGNGTFEITSDANGPSDGVLDLAGNDITSTTTFNSALLINVPEPGAVAMLIMGLGGMLLAGRGRRS
jgi:hypothetical protein